MRKTILESYSQVIFYTLIVILIGTTGWFSGHRIYSLFSYNMLLKTILLFIFLKSFIYKINTNSVLRLFCFIVVLLLIARLFVIYRFSLSGEPMAFDGIARFELVLKILARSLINISTIFLIYLIINKNFGYLYIILTIFVVAFIFMFFEHPITPFTKATLKLKQEYFAKNMLDKDLLTFEKQIDKIDTISVYRVSGPYQNGSGANYFMISGLILATYVYIKRKNTLFLCIFIFFTLTSILSLTRSLMFANIFLIIYILYFQIKNRKIRHLIILGSFLFLVIVIYYNNRDIINSLSRLVNYSDSSASGRLPKIISGILLIFQHPFGASSSDYDSNQFYIADILNNRDGIGSSHNGFLNLGRDFGIFGIFFFLYFMLRMIQLSKILNSQLKIFFCFSFIAYITHTSFHNGFIFFNDYFIILILSIFALEYKNANLKASTTENMTTIDSLRSQA
jgi:hypothetical protein